jgi:hypothetical protein
MQLSSSYGFCGVPYVNIIQHFQDLFNDYAIVNLTLLRLLICYATFQEEWRRGLKSMRVDSIDKLKKAFPALQQEVQKSLHEKHLLQ